MVRCRIFTGSQYSSLHEWKEWPCAPSGAATMLFEVTRAAARTTILAIPFIGAVKRVR
jgi:hypothetical protein